MFRLHEAIFRHCSFQQLKIFRNKVSCGVIIIIIIIIVVVVVIIRQSEN
jgi:hypothetical protein